MFYDYAVFNVLVYIYDIQNTRALYDYMVIDNFMVIAFV